MNLKMLYLILNDGRLGYLRRGWYERQGEDPVLSYVVYRLRMFLVTCIILMVAVCAVAGSYSITRSLIGIEPFSRTIALPDNFIPMLPTLLVLLASLTVGFGYMDSSGVRWNKNRQFVEDLRTLQSVVRRSIEDRSLVCLEGESDSCTVPTHVRQRLRERILSLARTVLEEKINGRKPSDRKEKIDHLVSIGVRFAIFSEGTDVGSFYTEAGRRHGGIPMF